MNSDEFILKFSKDIDHCINSGEYKLCPELILEGLDLNRQPVLNFIQSKASAFPSKIKLKIFETLVQDGKEDCVPCALALYNSETNLLYLKSLLFQFKGLPFKSVLRTLVQKEKVLAPDLLPTFQRVIGHLKNIFRETFYMEEFIAGAENEKKIHHATEMMIKEPHPDYQPFLHEYVNRKESSYRVGALKVLHETGDDTALVHLLSLLDDLIEEIRISRELLELLPGIKQPEKRMDDDFLEKLMEPLGLDRLRSRGFVIRIRTNTPPGGFQSLMDGYRIHGGSLRNIFIQFIKNVYLGTAKMSELRQTKLVTYLQNHFDHRREQLDLCIETMGILAYKYNIEEFPETLQSLIPTSYKERDLILVKLFATFRNEASRAQLLSFFEKESDPDNLSVIMNVLAEYELEEVSEKAIKLAGGTDNTQSRKAALNMVGRSKMAPEIFEQLLVHSSMVVRVDTLKVISKHYLTNCLPLLFELTNFDHPNSFLKNLLETFEEFPGEKTGEAVKKYLQNKFPVLIRLSALSTMLKSGGMHRYDYIFEALNTYSEKHLLEMENKLISELSEALMEEQVHRVVQDNPSIWEVLLRSFDTDRIMKNLAFLNEIQWVPDEKITNWIQLVREWQKGQIGLSLEAKKMLASFWHQLCRVTEEEEKSKTHKQFDEFLDQLEQEEDRAALQALRSMNAIFRPDLLKDYGAGYDKMVDTLFGFMERFDDEPQALIQAMGLFSRLHDPKVNRKLRQMLNHHLDTVANTARRCLLQSLGLKPDQFKVKKILVVDDSKFYCNQVGNYLDAHGFEATKAFTPGQGLEALQANAFDLLVLDFQMPEVDGLEFIQQARRQMVAPVAMMVMTSDQRRELIINLVEEGVMNVLVKPFKMDELEAKIAESEEQVNQLLRLLG